MNLKEKDNIDKILTYVFLKHLVTPIIKTDAYKMGLVDNNGRIIRQPKTDDEKKSLTLLDKTIFKIRRMLGAKVSQLNSFLFLQTLQNDFYNKLVVRGTVEQRAEIKRLEKDINGITENYDAHFEDLLMELLHNDIKNYSEITKL